MKTKQQIMTLLGIDELAYGRAVESYGYSFVRHYCSNSTGAEEYLTRTSAFWKWWMRHFDTRDEQFIADYGSYCEPRMRVNLRSLWNDSHQPDVIEGRIPDAAWMQMLDAIDEEDKLNRPAYAKNTNA
jgi:hypothetical protein